MALIGCLFVERLPLLCEFQAHPELIGRAVVVTTGDPPLIWYGSPEAERWGVRSGQKLAEAISLCKSVDVVEGRPVRYQGVTDRLVTSLDALVPGVAEAAEGSLLLDLEGLDRLYPGYVELGRRILHITPAWLDARLAVSDGAFIAGVIARQLRPGEVCVATGDAAQALLGAASIDVLAPSPELQRRLYLLGVTTVAELAALPKAKVIAGLGIDGNRLWRLAHGEDIATAQMKGLAEAVVVSRDLDDPIINLNALLAHAEELLAELHNSPQLSNRATRTLTLSCITERSGALRRTISFKLALSRPKPMWDVLRPALQRLDVSSPIIRIELWASNTIPSRGWQSDLNFDKHGRDERLIDAMHTLRVQNGGRCPVARIVEVEPRSRIPERRRAFVDYVS